VDKMTNLEDLIRKGNGDYPPAKDKPKNYFPEKPVYNPNLGPKYGPKKDESNPYESNDSYRVKNKDYPRDPPGNGGSGMTLEEVSFPIIKEVELYAKPSPIKINLEGYALPVYAKSDSKIQKYFDKISKSSKDLYKKFKGIIKDFENDKKDKDITGYGLGRVLGTNEMGFGYITDNGNVMPLRRIK